MTNLDSILKSRDITLSTEVCLVKAMVFPVVKYGCESWTVKKAEHRRIDAFELWESLGLQGDPTIHPKGNQSWVFIGRTDVEAETPILWPPIKELTHLKRPWCWKGFRAGGEWDDRGWDGRIASVTQCTWVWVDSGSSDGHGDLACCSLCGHKKSDMTEWLNWTELND